eukprot:Protomagalhaensia_sp_Gyna_25__1592@NODE_181_length_4580_cov_356_102841_g141_i0_p2_GENE_NODE_181_length_4580_cov_356_102841_g141_i0NODE_181_length_4580_cov_356_102841_g141_i0_p2_ORF_typecomplete_len412_score79_44Ribosomal_S4e/PF00900_20/1_5e27Ribosomal_S4e/PF00900_20/1_3e0240S_S4_C/PF16121_5/3_5e0240S_S4_C/PF16121_5/2e13RE_HaeIII/PF09556_10/0_28_NODE_181_length_4580_cov_356_102841_g141_i0711306
MSRRAHGPHSPRSPRAGHHSPRSASQLTRSDTFHDQINRELARRQERRAQKNALGRRSGAGWQRPAISQRPVPAHYRLSDSIKLSEDHDSDSSSGPRRPASPRLSPRVSPRRGRPPSPGRRSYSREGMARKQATAEVERKKQPPGPATLTAPPAQRPDSAATLMLGAKVAKKDTKNAGLPPKELLKAVNNEIKAAKKKAKEVLKGKDSKDVKGDIRDIVVKVDGKVRTDKTFPLGFMDVVSIDKTQKHYRILLNTKGRFVPHRIKQDETGYKLCRIRQIKIGKGAIPYAYLHDGRTIRFAHPAFRRNDTVKLDLETGKPVEHLKFDIGALAMVTAGHSIGRVGKVTSIEKHPGAADMIHLKDARNESFCTKVDSVFVIGTDNKCLVSLPKEKGIKKSILEVQREKYGEFHP